MVAELEQQSEEIGKIVHAAARIAEPLKMSSPGTCRKRLNPRSHHKMQPEPDRRRETRYPIEAEATVELRREKDTIPATTVDLSESGVFLRFKAPVQLAVGDEVTCEFKVRHGPDKALPYWGTGTVARVEGLGAGVVLAAVIFDVVEHGTSDSLESGDVRKDPPECA